MTEAFRRERKCREYTPGLMKTGRYILLFMITVAGSLIPLRSQNTGKNLDFSMGNFTNWVGYTWRLSNEHPTWTTSPVAGIVYRRQTIMSDTTEYDKNTGYALRKIPKGYKYSAKLGDEILSSDPVNSRCWNQSLRYTMKIDSSNALVILRFAMVLQYIASHKVVDEPRFRLTLYDNQGNVIPDCSNYDVYATNKYVKGFKLYTPPNSSIPVMWRDWTAVGVNLIKYLGQTITIEFMSADCAETYHYGYAYFIAECQPLYIKVKYCATDTEARLIAPEGFERYRWVNNLGVGLDTTQTLKVSVPDQKITYSCTLTSATGCVVTLQSSIQKYIPHADFSSFMLDCHSNTVQFLNLSSTNHGSLKYNWYFENENVSLIRDPIYTFNTSGIHRVTLILLNPPSACYDTLTKDVESFSPPLVGITGDSTYCPGLTTWMKAYGAFDYTWSNGSKADSVEAGAPGGRFWMLGRSSTGCISDTAFRTITEEPSWEVLKLGDTTICGSGKVTMRASGGVSYLWDNGTRDDSVSVSSPGRYTVTATNKRGCLRTTAFNVSLYQLPLVEFSFSPDALDRKNNTLTCKIDLQPGVNYFWDMGDGSSYGPASTVTHLYNTSNDTLYYPVTLVAKDIHNCTDTSMQYIDVAPFIPNVFTPDGDGINDVFMQGFSQEIVDRNGLRIYKGSEGWDGRRNGRDADPDTYFYIVNYSDSRNNSITRKGYLTLLRRY